MNKIGNQVIHNPLIAIIGLMVAISATLPERTQAATGFHVSGGSLLDANGKNFIIRGINFPFTWYLDKINSFADIKAAGANTIRVVLSSGQRWLQTTPSNVANAITLCKTYRLACILEVHDTTGFGDKLGDPAAATLSQAVSYWQQIQNLLVGQEAYVIINIGNEPYGNDNVASWKNDTINAISLMRLAGFHHALIVDAPNWGQDWQFIMRDNAIDIFNSDPDHNTIFSIHMYDIFNTATTIQDYISKFTNKKLPLVIGEFGSSADIDAIMAQAQAYGIGYLAWSWSGNDSRVQYLDMVTDFNPNQITSWGNRVINGPNGLAQISQEARAAVGVFRNGQWFLDANANGAWDGCGTEFCFTGFGQAGDMPASGNWDGGNKSYIGVLRSGTGEWFMDRNGNRQWDGCTVDGCYAGFGQAGDLPVAGDWNGTGFANIGVFRNGQWFLDANGNGAWDGCSTDQCLSFGQLGDLPVAGNWNGGVPAGVGVFRAGTWYLDYNGNGQWDGCDVDRCYFNSFGQAGDVPAAGDWNGDGKAKVGVFRAGTWYLDYNGNGAWDGCGVDRCYFGSFGQQGDLPVAGKW